ncbi:MAG: hypothetical protein HOG73_05270 [Candidatus Marinimicrobia bacterium]|jgi:hypothetical protein|nr:hypothetical protein [Candidatus Neomarinimicrobiota bacterium]MBT5995110.1 hypothetical protein [Candidatus Neomarinimicrobiota bacterium]
MKRRKEYAMGNYIFGHYICNGITPCPTQATIKSPIEWMVETGRWNDVSN